MAEYCDMGPECYSFAEYRARKEYRCCECRTPINLGEKYLRCFGVWEGEVSTFRQHILCAEACEWFRDGINEGDCLPFGSLFEEAREYFLMLGMDHKRDEDIAHWRKMLAGIMRRKRLSARGKGEEANG